MALTKEDVVSVLRTCRDPEIPVNIVDLGLIYDVDVREAAAAEPGYDVSVKMTLTSPGCPMSQSNSAEVHRKLLGSIACGTRRWILSGSRSGTLR